jgi:hypothetical protein
MTLLGGKTPRHRQDDAHGDSVSLSLVLKVGAVLAGVWLALVATFFGVRKMVGPGPAEEIEAAPREEIEPPQEKYPGMTPQGYVPAQGSKSAHEDADLHPGKIVGVAAALGVTLVGSILILAALFHVFVRAHPHRTSEAAPVVTFADIPPAPGVRPAPGAELLEVEQKEDLHLNHYGWVDASHTTARIPIERAMTLWVQTYSAPSAPVAPVTSAISPVAPAPNAPVATNAAAVTPPLGLTPASPGVTELQMRQEKATEQPHVP